LLLTFAPDRLLLTFAPDLLLLTFAPDRFGRIDLAPRARARLPTLAVIRVVTTPEASAFIAANGGVVYVRPLTRKCCGGALTVLSATTERPKDEPLYQAVGDPELGIRYRRVLGNGLRGTEGASATRNPAHEPEELLVELRGRRRPHLAACWNGCFFKM
jgi:hypothetical protein